MIENITADRIANSILQRRKNFDNFILVEGSHDRLLMLKFKNENSQIEITFGWEKLIEVVEKLKERGFEKIIGIIDLDLREIIPLEIIEKDNLVLTDDHDINIMSIEKNFSFVFDSYSSQDKVEKFKKEFACTCIKTYTYNLIKPLSFLKILNKRENLNLTFKSNDNKKNKFDYSKFIDKNRFTLISLEKLIETVVNFSRNKTSKKIIANDKILDKLKTILSNENYENNKVNCGHDFGEVICIGLKKTLGTKDVESEIFLKECILSFDSNDFKKLKMYSDIINVQKKIGTKFLKI